MIARLWSRERAVKGVSRLFNAVHRLDRLKSYLSVVLSNLFCVLALFEMNERVVLLLFHFLDLAELDEQLAQAIFINRRGNVTHVDNFHLKHDAI